MPGGYGDPLALPLLSEAERAGQTASPVIQLDDGLVSRRSLAAVPANLGIPPSSCPRLAGPGARRQF